MQSDKLIEKILENTLPEVPAKYTDFIDFYEALEIEEMNIVKAYMRIKTSPFFDVSYSIEFQKQNEMLQREMNAIGYNAAIIWFYESSLDEIMDIYEALEDGFIKAIQEAPNCPEEYLYMDFSSYDNDIYKLFGIFQIIRAHYGGLLKYYDIKNIPNMNQNMMHIRNGILKYIQDLIQSKALKGEIE